MGIDTPKPVSGWSPIDFDPSRMDAPSTPNNLLLRINANLTRLPERYFNDFHYLEDGSPATIPQKIQELQNLARGLIDQSQSPLFQQKIKEADMRNAFDEQRGRPPILNGDYLHGLPLVYLPDTAYGVLAGEFYGATQNIIKFRLYLSHIKSREPLDDLPPRQIITNSYSGQYGLGEGRVTLVFGADAEFVPQLPQGQVGPFISGKNGIPVGLPIGAPATDLRACIIDHSTDIPQAKTILSDFPFFIRGFTGDGRQFFTRQDWLSASHH